ncbi:MAG: hypothetical protein IT483_14440 [Gammaproteobacteria bacterium]|nr:hypothetical protein [Gammaproteobacteria bacterium]
MTGAAMSQAAILERLLELATQIERIESQLYLLRYEQATLRQRLRPAAGDE